MLDDLAIYSYPNPNACLSAFHFHRHCVPLTRLAFAFIESWWDDLTTDPDAKKMPKKRVIQKEPGSPAYSEYTFSNICDAMSDAPQRGERGFKLRYWIFKIMIQFLQRDPLRKRDSKAFKTPPSVRGSRNRLMNLSPYLPLDEDNWTENLKQLFWELEYMQSPDADDVDSDDEQNAGTENQEEDGEDEESDDDKMDTDDADRQDEAAIKANRDPELARLSRKFQRRGSAAALSTSEDRFLALSLLLDYCCKASNFKKLLVAWKQDDKNTIAAINAILHEKKAKKIEYEKKILAERAANREQKLKEHIASLPPQAEVAGAAPLGPRTVPKVSFVVEDSETVTKLLKERELALQQLDERRQDLLNRREEKLKKVCPQPLGIDRFMNSFWVFKSEEFGNLMFVESPHPWPELFTTRDIPESGESTLASKPEWTQDSNWFLVRTQEELDAVVRNLSKIDANEAALLGKIEQCRPDLLKSDHFCGTRFEKAKADLSYFDAVFRQVHGKEPAYDQMNPSDRAERARDYLEQRCTRLLLALPVQTVALY
jgi:hypothetical protein